MVANFVIGAVIFGYAGWALVRFIQKSKKGKCAACEAKKTCSSSCCTPAQQTIQK